VGEVTPNYLEHEWAVPRMAQVLPDAKLFVTLRDPAERALSAYRLYQHLYRGLSFAEVYRSSNLIEPGRYAKHLKRVFDYYPRNRVKIIFYEEVVTNPAVVLSDLFRYLGADPSFVPSSLGISYNHSSGPRINGKWGNRFRRAAALIKTQHALRWLRRWLAPRSRTSQRETIPIGILEDLRRIYQDDVLELQELIGRNCSAWLAVPEMEPAVALSAA
jgi:hypothetical protein